MFTKRYKRYLGGIGLVWLGTWLAWLASELLWMTTDIPRNLLALVSATMQWITIILGILFFIVTVSMLMLKKFKAKHPLLDDLENDVQAPRVRVKEKTWRMHKTLYLFIAPLRDNSSSWEEIRAKVETELGTEYPSSIDTLKAVYNKGKSGFYDRFPKTS